MPAKKPLLARWLGRWGIETTPLWDSIIGWIEFLLAIGVGFMLAQYTIYRTSGVGTSMYPTLQAGDKILFDSITFRVGIRPLQTGDIIDVQSSGFPLGRATKRLIAISGQRVSIKNCAVYVDGQPLLSDAFNHPNHPDPQRRCYYNAGQLSSPEDEVLVPENHYFVLGDNSANSLDSRFEQVGFIKKNNVRGRILLRIWPLSRFGVP